MCFSSRGVPFNIASYSLLTVMIARITGLRPGDFVYSLGDTHIYNSHVEAMRTQMQRSPFEFPRLVIKRTATDIDSFSFDDFELQQYTCHDAVAMKMAL